MNKNLRKIIAMTLAVGSVSALAPATSGNLLTTKAYASIGDINLSVEDEDGDSIKLYDEDDDRVYDNDDLDEDETYHVETSSDYITFDVDGADGGDKYVRIFKEDADDDDDGYSNGHKFSLDEDETFIIRVYDDDEDEDDVEDATYDSDLDYEEYEVDVEYDGDDDDDDDNDDDEFHSLKLIDESKNTIQLYDDDDYGSGDKVSNDDLDEGDTYYAKTSSDYITIESKGVDKDYIKVFTSTRDSAEGYDIDDKIYLPANTTTLTVRIYDDEPGNHVTYEEDDDVIGEYEFEIKYTNGDSTNADDYDDIYLDKLKVDGTSISLSNSKVAYTYNVNNNVDKVKIVAKPEDDDYKVKIDGTTVDEDDDYEKTVNLNVGQNKINISIEDDDYDDEREYTLTINRASAVSTGTGTNTTTTPNTTTPVTTVKANQWVLVNGIWQYNDTMGNPVKNMWVKNYYVDAYGNMATGWLNYSGAWYYLGTDGAKKTGWQLVSGSWYYLDGDGRMQTGWLRDISTGKYYYLNSNGTMASNTTIGGYKLGADGAWVTRT